MTAPAYQHCECGSVLLYSSGELVCPRRDCAEHGAPARTTASTPRPRVNADVRERSAMTAPRWTGYCHSCRRYDVDVETRYDRGAKPLCDTCSAGRWSPRVTPASTRRQAPCEGCGRRRATEFSLSLDARLCDACWREATNAR